MQPNTSLTHAKNSQVCFLPLKYMFLPMKKNLTKKIKFFRTKRGFLIGRSLLFLKGPYQNYTTPGTFNV